jgi:hypothetical protein
LARRFDRSVSWVSRRLALALKYLVPVARVSLEACVRTPSFPSRTCCWMLFGNSSTASAFVQQHCNTREAGQLYAAWSAHDSEINFRP